MEETDSLASEGSEELREQQAKESSSSDDREMFDAVCSDCGEKCQVPFKPTEGKPVRCKDCFAKNRPPRRSFGGGNRGGGFNGRSGGGFNSRPREEHKAKCSDCGKDCTVPFKPTQGKPVLCRDCYKKSKGFD